MKNLVFIGLISLNDPLRSSVPSFMKVCKDRNIKVVMITGDQPPTAANIALKAKIISDMKDEFNNLKQRGVNEEDAWKKCKAVVIHGDELARKTYEEEKLDENDPLKGKFLLDWLNKPEIIFARTTPSQKLQIVNACHKLGYIVAFMGDGVNDTPAMSKSDIAIATGSGTDVTKNIAHIILLENDFNSIAFGLDQGKNIYNHMKLTVFLSMGVHLFETIMLFVALNFFLPHPLPIILTAIACLGICLR